MTASIAYWGAVGSSCENVKLAYEFLSQFLEEEFQWDFYRPRVNKEGAWWTHNHDDSQFKGMIEDSLPVRIVGCVKPLWDNLQYQIKIAYTGQAEGERASRQIQLTHISDEAIPSLGWGLDRVIFPLDIKEDMSISAYLRTLNEAGGTPTDINIDELAQEVYQNLWWHLAEG